MNTKKNISSLRIIFLITSLLFFGGVFLSIPSFAEPTPTPETIPSPPTESTSSEISPETLSEDPSSETTTTKSAENTKSDNAALQILRDRQTTIRESFAESDEEKKIEEDQDALETVQAEKTNLEELNTDISLEIKTLKEELQQKQEIEQALENEQKKNKETQQELQEVKARMQKLQSEISTKNSILSKNLEELKFLSQEETLKKYYRDRSIAQQKELNDIKRTENNEKYTIFYIVSGLFILIYILRIYLSRKIKKSRALKKKYAHRLTAFDVFSVVIYIGFLIWFFFYIKPELVVYLLFLVGAIAIILQEYLFSMVSSIFIVQMYSVGDRILFQGKEGLIEKMTLLKISIRTIDERGTDMTELRIIPNSQFMKNEVAQLPKKSIEKANFRLVLPNDLSINQPVLTRYIEEEILKKNITVKSFNEITEKEYFYDIDFSFSNTGQPIININWYETREKSIRIKRKILKKLDDMKIKKNIKKCDDPEDESSVSKAGEE